MRKKKVHHVPISTTAASEGNDIVPAASVEEVLAASVEEVPAASVEERAEDITDVFPGLHNELHPGYFVEHVEPAANPLYERIHALFVIDIRRFSTAREQLHQAVDSLRTHPADDKARTAASQLYTMYSCMILDLETFLMPAGTYKPKRAYERISSDDLDRIAATSYAHAAN